MATFALQPFQCVHVTPAMSLGVMRHGHSPIVVAPRTAEISMGPVNFVRRKLRSRREAKAERVAEVENGYANGATTTALTSSEDNAGSVSAAAVTDDESNDVLVPVISVGVAAIILSASSTTNANPLPVQRSAPTSVSVRRGQAPTRSAVGAPRSARGPAPAKLRAAELKDKEQTAKLAQARARLQVR